MLAYLLRTIRKPVPSVVQEAEPDDLVHLAEIHRTGFARGWTDGEFAKLMANEAYFCLVARKKGRPDKPPAAFILVRVAADEAEIISISTKKSARRKGVARQLVDAAIRRLQADRIGNLFLEVDETNQPAIRLYQKLGFRQVGSREGYYTSDADGDGKPSSALVMQRDLG